MAGFTDALRGDGLAKAHRALGRLEADPSGLDRARSRFSQSLPLYSSNPSGTTTRSANPEPSSDEQQQEQRFRRWRKLVDERAASLPLQQFLAQVNEEKQRIWNANPQSSWMGKIPIAGNEEKEAIQTIKKCWVDQGIWKDKWDEMAAGRYMNVGKWKHEESLELESESETDTEAESPPPSFSIFGVPEKQSRPKPRRPKNNDEKQRVAERRAVQEREHEASRPYHQFMYQISKERKRIQDGYTGREGTDVGNPDINTTAYENVKNTWSKRGIWNRRWGILPGMSWKHEQPLEEGTTDGPGPGPVSADLLGNGTREAGEVSTIPIFGPPSPVELNHRQASEVMRTSHQRSSTDIDSARLEDSDAIRSPSALNSPPLRTGKRVLRPTRGQTALSAKRKPSYKDGQPQLVASASLGPVHSSKISKVARKKRPGPQRRPRISENVSSSSIKLSTGVDTAEPPPSPAHVAPRRSSRIQRSVLSIAKNPTRTVFTDRSKRAVRSKPERTTRSSAKPQGISKKQRPVSAAKRQPPVSHKSGHH